VFDGCGPLDRSPDPERAGPPSTWLRLHVTATLGVDAAVQVEARHAGTRAELGDAKFVVLGELPGDTPPFELDFDPGGVVEVRLTLRVTGRIGAPRVSRVGLEWRCPGPI
jgi:hypothetical protein